MHSRTVSARSLPVISRTSSLALAIALILICLHAPGRSRLSVVAAPDQDCLLPLSGDWTVVDDCELRVSYGAHGNVRVTNGATLRLTEDAILGIEFESFSLRIDKGAQVRIDPGSRIDALQLELAGLEVTQAVQDLEGTMRSIAGKETYVRAYVQATGDPVANVAVRLRAFRDGTELPGSPLPSSPAMLGQVAGNVLTTGRPFATSANFRLPAGWRSGTTTYRVEAVGEALRCIEQAGTDQDCQAVVSYQRRRRPVVWVAPLNTGNAAAPAPAVPALVDIVAEQDLMEAMYPVSGITFVRQNQRQINPATTATILADLNGFYDNTLLAWIFGLITSGAPPFALPDQIYGATAGPIGAFGVSDPVWLPPRRGRVAYGTRMQADGTTVRGETMAHEINHNLDRSASGTWGRHAPNCGAAGPDPNWPRTTDNIGLPPLVGFDLTDPANPVIHPITRPDLMSACRGTTLPGRWISDYRWQRLEFPPSFLFTSLLARESEAIQQAPSASDVVSRVHLDLELERGGGGAIRDASVLPSIEASEERHPQGFYRLVFESSDGAERFKFNFDAVFEDANGEPLESVRTLLRLPVSEGVSSIRLYRGETELDQFIVSTHPPVVEVTEPNGGEEWTQNGSVRWEASDPDGDALHARVFYSPQEHVWQVVASGLTDGRLEIPTDAIPGSDAARIRVLVSDGYHTAMDESDETFTVGGKAPRVLIVSPRDGAQHDYWEEISLRADANDPEDGALSGEAVVWTVDGAPGVLAIGARTQVSAARIGPGEKLLRMTATDHHGNSASDVVRVLVAPPASRLHLPSVSVQRP